MGKSMKAMVIGMDALILPLVRKWAGEGVLPNFSRLISEGASSEALPCLPAWTPTNWAVLATGAYTGTNNCYLWSDHLPTDPDEKLAQFTFDSRAVTAEFIWEAAERAGIKTLCISYPGAWPPRVKKGYVITPLDRGVMSKPLVPGTEYTNQPNRKNTTEIQLTPASGWQNMNCSGLEAELVIGSGITPIGIGWGRVVDGKVTAGWIHRLLFPPPIYELSAAQEIRLNLLVFDSRGQGYDRILIYNGKDSSKPLVSIGIGEWSDWVFLEFPYNGSKQEGSVRFKLLSLDRNGENLRLIRSEVYPTTNWTYPESLGNELLTELGPFLEWPSTGTSSFAGGVAIAGQEEIVDILLRDTYFEELRYQAMWLPKAAGYMQRKYGWDLCYQHWHAPDSVAHACLSYVDTDSPFYSQGTEAARNTLKETYRIADEMLGAFLGLADEDTYVIVVSDHGCTPDYNGVANIHRLLSDHNLLALMGGQVDWSRTRAFPHGIQQIEINLKGRNQNGIVAPEDYERVQEEIIDALYSWKDPETGKRPIAFALKKRDAQLIGYWGPTTADIVCCYNGGFSVGLTSQGRSIGPARDFAEHGAKVPTDRTGTSSNLGTFLIKGPGIRAGYERDPERLGFIHLVDVVPTISHLMGFRPPAQSQGAVLWDMIE